MNLSRFNRILEFLFGLADYANRFVVFHVPNIHSEFTNFLTKQRYAL